VQQDISQQTEGLETNEFHRCRVLFEGEKTKDYLETIVNVLLATRVQLTHKSNVNVGNCAGFFISFRRGEENEEKSSSQKRLVLLKPKQMMGEERDDS
jgi:uncharacterized protein YwqG